MFINSSKSEKEIIGIIGFSATALFLLYSFITMVALLVVGVFPDSIEEILLSISANNLRGLIQLDVLTLIFMPVYFCVYFALYRALSEARNPLLDLVFYLCLMGFALFLSSPSLFPLVKAANGFSGETDALMKERLLSVGETLRSIDMWSGTNGILGGVLIQIAACIFSLFMLHSRNFGRITAITGIVVHTLDLLHFFIAGVSKNASVILMAIAGVIYLVWLPLLLNDFHRIMRKERTTASSIRD